MRNLFFNLSPIFRNLNIFSFVSFFLIFLFTISCKKDPGEGGAATIKGKLLAANYHSQTTTAGSDDGAAEEAIYIIYGDNTIADHNEKTSYDGSFEFKYLRKGTYTIFAYSLDKNSAIPVETIISKTIEIKDKKETMEVTDFIIYKEADKGGSSAIKGKVFMRDYDMAFTTLQSEYYKSDEDVLIIFGNDTINDDNTKTSFDGSFQFDGLRKGIYKVYAFSKDSAKIHDPPCTGCSTIPDSAVVKTIEITANNQEITLPDIVIFKN